MAFIYVFALLMAVFASAADIDHRAAGGDLEARAKAKAWHLSAWHAAAAGWYGSSEATRGVAGDLPSAAFRDRLPGGAGGAATFTASGLRSRSDGAGSVVSWIDTADSTERAAVGAEIARRTVRSIAVGSFDAATRTIVSGLTDLPGRVPVPASVAAHIPDGAPVAMTTFQ